MGWLNIVLVLYSLLNILMGVLGFYRAHSVISLIAGVAAGMLVLGSMAWSKTNPRGGRILALVVSLLLAAKFAQKALANELYPSGIMFAASVGVAICLLAGHMIGMRAKKQREKAETWKADKEKR